MSRPTVRPQRTKPLEETADEAHDDTAEGGDEDAGTVGGTEPATGAGDSAQEFAK